MWAALKADMSEFVSTVKEEAADTLNVIDQNMDDDDEEEVEEALMEGEQKLDYLHSCPEVFSTPLPENIEFEFNVDAKTQEISQLLNEHPETLQQTFAFLTSQVEYAEFWKRYFYRLDDERIDETYDHFYTQEEPELSTLGNVTNFLGGAVKRLVEEHEHSQEEPFFQANTAEASAKSALGFLTGGGRPPFALNTAVSSDDDDDDYLPNNTTTTNNNNNNEIQAESLDEEEELGWGSDEEFDDEDEDGQEEEEENVIEFKDKEKELLEQKLQQAQEERDQLHKTVEVQTQELAKFKTSSAAENKNNEDDLKMQLFEKQSELAVLKAKLEDVDESPQEEIIQQLQQELKTMKSEKDHKIKALQEQVANVVKEQATQQTNERKELEQHTATLTAELEGSKQKAESLQLISQASKRQLDLLKEENVKLTKKLSEAQAEVQEMDSAAQDDEEGDSIKKENDKLYTELQAAKEQIQAMEAKLTAQSQESSIKEENDKLAMELNAAQAKLQEALKSQASLQEENEKLSKELEAASVKTQTMEAKLQEQSQDTRVTALEEENAKLSSELQLAQTKSQTLNVNLEQVKGFLKEAAEAAAKAETFEKEKMALEEELETFKDTYKDLERELEEAKAAQPPKSPGDGSNSTGVKVEEEAATPVVTKIESDDDDGGDWGDDW